MAKLVLITAVSSHAAPPNVEYTVIAWSGDVRPGGTLPLGSLDPPCINDSGAVAFYSSSGNDAIWQGSVHNALRAVALKGGAAPAGAFDSFSTVMQDNAGRVLFSGELATGTGGITAANNEGYWAESTPGTLVEIARKGMPAPGVPGSKFFGQFNTDSVLFGNNGLVLFRSDISSLVDQVVLAGQPGNLQLVARSRQQPPGLATGLGWRLFDVIGATGAGTYFFQGEYWQNSNQQFKGYGLWSNQSGTLSQVFIDEVTAGTPPGYNVQDPSDRDIGINGAGRIVMKQLLTDPSDSADSGNALYSNTRDQLQYETGYPQPAPGLNGVSFADANDYQSPRPLVNAQDRIAFSIYLRGQGVTTQNNSALWMGTGNQYALVARGGMQAPGVAAGTNFSSVNGRDDQVSALSLGSGGHLVFHAFLTNAGTANTGIWMTDRAGQLRLMARRGDTITLPNGMFRTFNEFDMMTGSGGDDGRPRCVNASGQLAFKVTFSGGDSAIIRARITNDPTPPAAEVPTVALTKGAPGKIVLSWTTTRTDCVVQATSNPAAGPWQTVTDQPSVNGNARTLELPVTAGARFFRIKCP